MKISRKATSLFAPVVLALVANVCHAADMDIFCNLLPRYSPYNQNLFFITPNGQAEPLSRKVTTIEELKGKSLQFYLILKRGEYQPQPAVRAQGAVNVKVELWQPDGGDVVYLFNNHHLDENSSCTSVSSSKYELFHQNRIPSSCLQNGFHNPRGDFSTLNSPEKLASFLFSTPPQSLREICSVKITGQSIAGRLRDRHLS
jgi:hypothetical protein